MIHKREHDSESHLGDSEDDGGLHFHGIQEVESVLCHVPHWVDSERIRSVVMVEGDFWWECQVELGLGSNSLCIHGLEEGRLVRVDPAGAEHVDGFGVEVVVDESGVDGEHAHEQDDVATSEEGVEDLVLDLHRDELLLEEDEGSGGEKHDDSVTCVSEHDSKEEGEGDDGPGGWVDFSVVGDSVGVDDVLESLGELVQLEVRRRVLVGLHLVQDRWDSGSRVNCSHVKGVLDLSDVCLGHPALGDQTLLGDIYREHVEGVEDTLQLQKHDSPLSEVAGSSRDALCTIIQSLLDDRLHVVSLNLDIGKKLGSLACSLRDCVAFGLESVADLLDLGAKLLSGEEENEDGLVLELVREQFGLLGDRKELGEHLSTGEAPEEALECDALGAFDDSSHKLQLILIGHRLIVLLLQAQAERSSFSSRGFRDRHGGFSLALMVHQLGHVLQHSLHFEKLNVIRLEHLGVLVNLDELFFELLKVSLHFSHVFWLRGWDMVIVVGDRDVVLVDLVLDIGWNQTIRIWNWVPNSLIFLSISSHLLTSFTNFL